MKLPEEPSIQVSVREVFSRWWTQHRDVEGQEEETVRLVMPRGAWRELWRYIRDCEELIENTRVRGK